MVQSDCRWLSGGWEWQKREFSQVSAVWGSSGSAWEHPGRKTCSKPAQPSSEEDNRAPDAKPSMPWSLLLCSQPSGRRLICSGFGNSIPPPEDDDFSTSGKHKAGCPVNCAPNLTGDLLSSVPNNRMAGIGSMWKLLIFSCFLCFPLTVINNCSEGKVTVTWERLRQPNTLGLFLWILKLRLAHYQKLFARSEFNVMTF